MEEIELIGKRKPREKHFLQKDGTIIAKVYDTDIHFLKDGKYEEIDNTLVKNGDLLVNKSNDFKVEFEETLNKYLMKMKKDDNYLNIRLSDCNHSKIITGESPSKLEQSILYDDVIEDISIQYKTLPNKVKETIVLKSNKYSKINFIAETNLDLSMKDNCIIATKNGEKIFELEAPYMEDSEGKVNNNIYYYLVNHGDHYDIELNLDSNWLNSLDIKYPVYVDPTINSTTENLNLYDTYIYPGDTSVNRYNLGYLKAGTEKINGQERINRTLLKFDLPTIGTGYEIVDAELSLISYAGEKENNYDHLIEVHRLTADWTESGANWNSMHDKYDDRVEVIVPAIRSEIVNDKIIGNPLSLSITGLVKKWYEDTPNYGIMIKSCDENYINDRYPMFYSKNNTIKGNPQPIFIIKYKNKNGIESYWDYKTHSFTDGQAYVNTHTGNLTTIFELGNTIGGPLPASLNLVYNTNDVILENKTFFGNGFKLNLEQVVEKIDDRYQYLDEDGTTHYFNKEESNITANFQDVNNSYYDEDGLDLKIEELDSSLRMTDIDNNEMIFTKIENKYYLTSVKDVDNNTLTIELNNNNSICKITDKYNSEINIQYNENNITITSSDNTTVKLNYSNNILTSLESTNGITKINYNENNIISSILDVTGLRTEFEYYEKKPYRMKKVKEFGTDNKLGIYYSIEYSIYETLITDENGFVETIAFNEYGNVVSRNILKDKDGIYDAYSIEKAYDNKNKLTADMIPTKYVKNYLNNTSFESENHMFTAEQSVNISFDVNNVNSGLKSLKIESNIPEKSIEQHIQLEKGEYYTFSGYFKNEVPVKLTLSYTDYTGNEISCYENVVVSGEFERNDVTIYYGEMSNSNLKIKITLLEAGTVYLDDIQLEKGEVANNYNLIENSDFAEGLSGWDCSAHIGENEVNASDYIDIVDLNDKVRALRVNMKYNVNSSVSKKYDIRGKEGESYTLSFWYKNEATIAYAPYVGSNVSIFYEPYNDDFGHCILSTNLPITNGNSWQHFVYTEKSIEDFKSIKINIFNSCSANSLYITNLSLYKNVTRGEYEYDENNNLISIKDQSDNTNVFKYDKDNQLISVTDAMGKDFKYEYDKIKPSRVINAIASSGISNQIIYDKMGNPVTTRISKKYVDDIKNGLYKIRNKGTKKYLKAELNMVLLEENDCSNTIWRIEQIGDYYKFIYNMQPDYSISFRNGKIVLDRADTNNLFEIEKNIEGDNKTYHIKYNETITEGTKVRFLSCDNHNIKALPYNESTDIDFYIEILSDLFIENNATYTDDGKFIKEITDSNLRKTIYNTDNNTGLLDYVINPNSEKTKYIHNSKGQVTKIEYGDKEINYEYGSNNLVSKIKQDNKEFNLNYDSFLNLSKIDLNDKINLTEYFYNKYSKIEKMKYGNGGTISYDYDTLGNIDKIYKMDNVFCYKYDSSRRLAKINSNSNTYRYYYDICNRLYKFVNNNFRIDLKYDKENFITEKKYSTDDVSHIINIDYEEELPKFIKLDSNIVSYIYDSLDRILGKNINNLLKIRYKYKNNGNRATDIIESYSIDDNTYEYKYDKNHNITDVYLNSNLINHYEYDKLSELIKEYDYRTGIYTEYTYNNSGNMLKKDIRRIANDDLVSSYNYNYNNLDWEDQLTSYNDETIEYDLIGNPIKIGKNELSWINGTELREYNNYKKNSKALYEYDMNGIRTCKVVDGIKTKYYLDEKHIIMEKTGNNTIYYLYDLDGIVGLRYDDKNYFYLKDYSDDIIGIIDGEGEKIVSYKYDSWGNILSILDKNGNEITDKNNIGIINPFRYRSYYYDNESDLYYLNNRYYNPKWGRFISIDSYIGANQDILSNNLYLYVSNNPINNIDPDGHSILGFIGKTISNIANKLTKKRSKKKKKKKTEKQKNIIQKFIPKVNINVGKNNSLNLGETITKTAGIGYTNEIGSNKNYNIIKSKSPLSINFNLDLSNIWESSISLDYTGSKFNISGSVGLFGYRSLKVGYKKSYNDTRVFEVGKSVFGFYAQSGIESSDEASETTSYSYGRVSVSKLVVALAAKATTFGQGEGVVMTVQKAAEEFGKSIAYTYGYAH